jgi:hypothetical protein
MWYIPELFVGKPSARRARLPLWENPRHRETDMPTITAMDATLLWLLTHGTVRTQSTHATFLASHIQCFFTNDLISIVRNQCFTGRINRTGMYYTAREIESWLGTSACSCVQ